MDNICPTKLKERLNSIGLSEEQIEKLCSLRETGEIVIELSETEKKEKELDHKE